MKLVLNSLGPPLRLMASTIAGVLLLAGCAGVQTQGEKRARQDQDAVGRTYRPGGETPTLPKLDTNAPLHDFLLFAMLNQPQVEAAYFEWASSVERITVERSCRTRALLFQSDIADMVMWLMPVAQSCPRRRKKCSALGKNSGVVQRSIAY